MALTEKFDARNYAAKLSVNKVEWHLQINLDEYFKVYYSNLKNMS